MPIFYGKREARTWGFCRYEDQDATGIFVKNYRKYLILDFISKNDDFKGKEEARKEMLHCENLLLRWKYHPNWDEEWALRHVERMKKMSIPALFAEMMREESEG